MPTPFLEKFITEVKSDELVFFSNLNELDISENEVRIEQLTTLSNLQWLNAQSNFIRDLNFSPDNFFTKLDFLDLSYNRLNFNTISNLMFLPNLR